MVRPWPLCGRDEELRAVAAAVRGGGPGVVVAGPAGVGKSRLVRDALALAVDGSTAVVRAHGSAAARLVPLGAFAGLLDLPTGEPADVIARVLDELSRRRPLVLVVDDAHLLDEHSALVLHRTVVRGLAPAVLTLRTGLPATDAVPDTVTSLWKDEHLPRLDLGPLDAATSAELVARVLGGPVESASAQRLWSLTRGTPLFLRHLLDGEVSAGRMSAGSGLWRWTDQPTITPQLADLLERQIGALAAGVRDVVDLVALAEPLPAATLSALTSPADVEEAEQRGLVQIDSGAAGPPQPVVRLAHPLYGEVRRAAMGSLRARRLRGTAARTLDATTHLIPRAVLTLHSDLPPDPALFLRAAQAATAMYDLPLAERLADAAAASGDPAARLVHAAALSWLTRGEDADAILVDVVDRATDPLTVALAQLHRTGNLLWTAARPDDARRALDAARAAGALPLHVAAMGLALDAAAGRTPAVLDAGPVLLEADLPDELSRILAASAVSAAAAVAGRLDLLDVAAAVGGLTGDRVPTVVPGFGLADLQVLGNRLAGRLARADDQAARMLAASSDLPGPARWMGLVVAGHAALARGRLDDATRLLREAWDGLAESGHEFAHRCCTLLATARAQAGDAAGAAPLLARLAADPHPAYDFAHPDVALARAWGAAAEGSTTEALDHVRTAADLAREAGADAYAVLAGQTAVQFGDPTAASRLDGLARLDGPAGLGARAAAVGAHARAWADEDAEALLEAARGWEALGDLVAAGDAAAQAADVHRRHDRHGSALSAVAVAAGLAARSGARTPALAVALTPLPLTAREREIAALAARGLSNRDIARRLTVSVRTVEGHLYRAGLKLGVSERTALGAVLAVE